MIQLSRKRFLFGPVLRKFVADPQAKHYRRLKQAVWMYLYLVAFVNPKTGKLLAQVSEIAHGMGLPEETLRSWLGHLRKWHYVQVEKQEENKLLFKITHWQDISPPLGTIESSETPKKERIKKTEKPSEVKQELPAIDNSSELAEHIIGVLGEPAYRSTIENLCGTNPRTLIQKALHETQRVPSEKIKKTRSALFVYLVKKYAKEKQPPLGH